MVIGTYRHIFSPNVVGDFRAMVRNNSNDFYSNDLSTPIILFQHNWFNEFYFKGMLTIDHGRNEWKVRRRIGQYMAAREFQLHHHRSLAVRRRHGPDLQLPRRLSQPGQRPDLEQSAFVQDLIRLGNWTINAGLRWDHYQLVVNKHVGGSRALRSRDIFRHVGLLAHFSYDRVFQTPSFENILLSNSFEVAFINPDFLRVPVEPSQGNYYEAGVSKAFGNNLRVDVNYYLA